MSGKWQVGYGEVEAEVRARGRKGRTCGINPRIELKGFLFLRLILMLHEISRGEVQKRCWSAGLVQVGFEHGRSRLEHIHLVLGRFERVSLLN